MLDRVVKALNRAITEEHENVLVVTHSAVIMCLICMLRGIPFERMTEYKPGNAEMVKIQGAELQLES